MSSDVNDTLKVYLGADEKGGFNPIGCDERLTKAFPSDHAQKRKLIARYLAESHTPNWSKHDLVQEGAVFAEILRKKFPELEAVVVRALANRFTYDSR